MVTGSRRPLTTRRPTTNSLVSDAKNQSIEDTFDCLESIDRALGNISHLYFRLRFADHSIRNYLRASRAKDAKTGLTMIWTGQRVAQNHPRVPRLKNLIRRLRRSGIAKQRQCPACSSACSFICVHLCNLRKILVSDRKSTGREEKKAGTEVPRWIKRNESLVCVLSGLPSGRIP